MPDLFFCLKMLRASNQTTIITWVHTGMRPGYAANHLTTFPSLPVCILGYMRRKPGQRGQQLHLSRSPFQVTGDQGIRVCNVSLSHHPTSETDKSLWPPSHPTCANRADRTALVLTTVLYLPLTTVLRDLQMPLKVMVATEPALRKGGCWSCRTQRKVALELLSPHLGSSKVQWMNNSLSMRFCSCGWSCSPYF